MSSIESSAGPATDQIRPELQPAWPPQAAAALYVIPARGHRRTRQISRPFAVQFVAVCTERIDCVGGVDAPLV